MISRAEMENITIILELRMIKCFRHYFECKVGVVLLPNSCMTFIS